MATLVNKDAPYSGLSSLMALRGRGGDTELVHMSKPEVRGLASLGELTINPDTGLPEAFKLKSLLPAVAGIAASFIPGGGLLVPALATGLTSAVVNKDIGRGLFDGLLSYAGGSIMKGLAGGEEFAKAAGASGAGAGAASQAAAQQTAVNAAGSNVTATQLGMAQQAATSPLNYVGAATIPSAAVGAAPSAVAPTIAAPTMASTFTPTGALGKLGEGTLFSPAAAGSAVDPLRYAYATGDISGLTTTQMAGYFAPKLAMPIIGEGLSAAMTPQVAPYPTLEEQRTEYVPEQRTITRVPLRSTPVTQEQALAAATGETGPLRFFDYKYANKGGLIGLAEGGLLSGDSNRFFEGMVPGTEHGMKDNVAFKVKGGNIDTAMLSPGEYVIPADVVSMLGNGNGDSGAKALDQFAKGIRQKAFGTKEQQKQLDAGKELNKIMA